MGRSGHLNLRTVAKELATAFGEQGFIFKGKKQGVGRGSLSPETDEAVVVVSRRPTWLFEALRTGLVLVDRLSLVRGGRHEAF